MLQLSGSEMLFWAGIIIMISSIAIAFTGAVVFTLTGRKIKQQLEREYGKAKY